MRKNYIVFDLELRKVVYESRNEQGALNYISNNGAQSLYLITLFIDTSCHTIIHLDGRAF